LLLLTLETQRTIRHFRGAEDRAAATTRGQPITEPAADSEVARIRILEGQAGCEMGMSDRPELSRTD
jgi:hypothetical protein